MKLKDKISFKALILIIAVLGFFIGYLTFSNLGGNTGDYCKSIEKGLEQNRSFSGPVQCFNTDEESLNISQRIENKTELECVCRTVQSGQIRLIPIARSN